MTKTEEYTIDEIEEEENDFYSDDDLYNMTSWGADLSFRELITMYDEGELLKPELQRNYVWDKPEASRFIETLLMGLPVPSIFLAKVGEKRLIVDGYQRLMTVYDYVNGIFTKDNKLFKLSNSSMINKRWRGKAFKELTNDEQGRIKRTTIHAIIFKQKQPRNDDTSMYQIFERINTGGRTLFPQEIRNCVYQGPFNTLLIELNKNETWRKLYGSKDPDPRMRDIEFILRFFALKSSEIRESQATQISLKRTLNIVMGDVAGRRPEILKQREIVFIQTMEFINNNFGKNAFHNLNTNRFHPTIFDAIAISTAYALEANPNLQVENKRDKRKALLNNNDFKTFTTERTTNVEHINGRISLAFRYLYI